MKIIKLLTSAFMLLAMVGTAKAQTTTADVLKEWERAKAYTKDYLEAMPETGYALKPTPAMRSFAEQMLHLGADNYVFAAAAMGEKNPEGMDQLEKTSGKTKAAVTKNVLDSYDYVIATIKKMSATQLNEKVKLFDRFEMSRELALGKGFEHQTHHRGQTTVYIRLAGATPPQEKLF
ncbi:damage-inducible protein DinB [Pedobacter petrophilus]|uniref:Damage-inducible protein DinB n=1 Tax=Pedobacter petrophilus TaxID=1908241 RepID=A0A7K0G335_9SPHI|nr:DinB family protein [Pedobacter petrophilus]MRX78225.1 damage-inducible protein DinB [Pedobacter petrophilus]